MFQTDSDADVIFVSAKCAPKSSEITFDQVKLLALQRDIDQQSQPKQLAKPQTSQGSVAVERPVEMKMEGETGEENVVKKKKSKKRQASLPENCAANDGDVAEVKKEKKKGKKADTFIKEEESWDGGGKKEKKKKRKIVTEVLTDASVSDLNNGHDEEISKKKKKKKKKKEQQGDGDQVEPAQILVKEEGEKKQKKKNKNKSKEIEPVNVNMVEEEEEEGERHTGNNELPKKAKKRKNCLLVVSSEETMEQLTERKKKKKKKKKTEEEATEAMSGLCVTKKKNKAKTKLADDKVKLETSDGETGEVGEVKVKKKKKKGAKMIEDGIDTGTPPQIKGNNDRSKEERDESTKTEIGIAEGGNNKLKRKGKKEKGRKAFVEVSEVEEAEPKKKKKKKKKGTVEEEEPLLLDCEEIEEQRRETPVTVVGDKTSKKSKRKKSSIQVETRVEEVRFGAKKKKAIKEEVEDQHESPQMDVVFLSEKTGNADEVTINQERRQALQMEIDKASQPQQAAKPAGFGQWSTAQFDSSDQQQKFLRLMGGFKKGFQPAAESSGRANMALGRDAQLQLQQGLQGEFERAHSRRVDFNNRGAGLGFAAPPNKKFSIDVNACRSVRFDD